jgi:hypothetical protein
LTDPNINVSINITGKKIFINLSKTAPTGKYLYYPINTLTGEAIYSGMILYSYPPNQGTIIINRGGLPFTNIEPSMLNYPDIRRISITSNDSPPPSSIEQWDIKAEVYNASESQIHADLTAITENIWEYDVKPVYNSNTHIAKWSSLVIPNTQQHQTLVATFWANKDEMQYYTQAVFYKSGTGWK